MLQETIPGIEWTATSVRFTQDITFETLEEVMRRTETIGDAVRWWIGGMLDYAEKRWGEQHAQLLAASRLSERQCRRYQYVHTHVAEIRRRSDLSFSHHEEVASLAPEPQARLLAAAAEASWSHRDLRERVQEEKQLDALVRQPRARQEVLAAGPTVDAAAGLATVRESLAENFRHLRDPEKVPALQAAKTIAPALRALDEAGETLAAASKVVDVQNALDRAAGHYRQALTDILAVCHWDVPDIEKIREHAQRGIRAADHELKEVST
jgi:hypothetical protein